MPKEPTIISTLLKARAVKAFVSKAGERRGGEGGWGGGGWVLVVRTAGTEPQCLAWSGEIPFHLNHTSSSSSFPSFSCSFYFPSLLPPPRHHPRRLLLCEALKRRADSTDKWVNWLVGYTHLSTHTSIPGVYSIEVHILVHSESI